MIDHAIYSILSSNSGVSTLVGTKIYPFELPQRVSYPAIIYQRISTTDRIVYHGGVCKFARSMFQITAIDDDILGAKTLAEKIRLALHGYTGTVSTIKIFLAQVLNEFDLFVKEVEDYQVSMDFEITHTEA